MKRLAIFAAAAAFAFPATAFAQDAHAGHDAQQHAAATAEISDAEISQFVTIGLQGRAMSQDESLSEADRQTAVLGMIGQSEMGLERFSTIAQAVSADEALQARVEAEVVQQLGALAAAD